MDAPQISQSLLAENKPAFVHCKCQLTIAIAFDRDIFASLDHRFEADDSDIVARILLAQEEVASKEGTGSKSLATEEEAAVVDRTL